MLVFTGRIALDAIFEVRVVAFAQRHAKHFKPRASQVGAQEEVDMKGPV